MVSVLPATVAGAVRPLAALAALAAGEPPADAAVMPPAAARAASPMPAMMIVGRFIAASLLRDLSTKTTSRVMRFISPRLVGGCGLAGHEGSRPGRRRERTDLVARDGFPRQQRGLELLESIPVAGAQLTSAGLCPRPRRGDFLPHHPPLLLRRPPRGP